MLSPLVSSVVGDFHACYPDAHDTAFRYRHQLVFGEQELIKLIIAYDRLLHIQFRNKNDAGKQQGYGIINFSPAMRIDFQSMPLFVENNSHAECPGFGTGNHFVVIGFEDIVCVGKVAQENEVVVFFLGALFVLHMKLVSADLPFPEKVGNGLAKSIKGGLEVRGCMFGRLA